MYRFIFHKQIRILTALKANISGFYVFGIAVLRDAIRLSWGERKKEEGIRSQII